MPVLARNQVVEVPPLPAPCLIDAMSGLEAKLVAIQLAQFARRAVAVIADVRPELRG